jgi:hypothetical protein
MSVFPARRVSTLSPRAWGLASVLLLPLFAACPGQLDPSLNSFAQGTGGDGTATGGAPGTGGSNPGTGGSNPGTGGAGTGGNTTPACDAPGMIFRAPAPIGCLGSSCHSPGAQNQPPDLSGTDVATTLQGMKSQVLCATPPELLVDPTNPANSVLMKVVSGTSCLIQMPLNAPPLSSTLQSCLMDWISKLP